MGKNRFRMLIILSVFLQTIPDGQSSKEASKLLSHLLNNYQILARPVKNESDAVVVRFGITLMKIYELDETKEMLKSQIWQTLEWTDASLTWDPKEFGNITNLHIPPSRMWTPDIHLYNSDSEAFDTRFQTLIVVRNHGNVTYIPAGIHTTSCKIDYRNFPFDHQKCSLKFGSWSTHGWQVDIQAREGNGTNIDMDISSYMPHPTWNLLRVVGTRDVIRYTCCPEPYVSMTFTITLQRKGGQILSEAKGSSFFICLTLILSFLIPPSSGHKITLAILHLCNVWYTLWAIANKYPNVIEKSSGNGGPLIGYFQFMKLLSEIVLTINVVIFCLYRVPGPIPAWLQKHVIQRISKLSLLGIKVSSPDAVPLQGIGAPEEDSAATAAGVQKSRPHDWKYLANFVNCCSLVIFTLISLLTWIFLFPSFTNEQKLKL